jgi:hypothetical protein
VRIVSSWACREGHLSHLFQTLVVCGAGLTLQHAFQSAELVDAHAEALGGES